MLYLTYQFVSLEIIVIAQARCKSVTHILYFDQTGKQVKGATATNPDGSISYYDVHTGEKAINRWVKIPSGQWVYFNAQGKGYVSN